MRHVLMFSMVCGLLAFAGCQKKQQVAPPADTMANEQPMRNLESLAPEEAQPSSPVAETTTDAKTAAATSGQVSYTIKKGDTLYSLAKQFLGDGKRWQDIKLANPGLDEKKLKVGQTIVIPAK